MTTRYNILSSKGRVIQQTTNWADFDHLVVECVDAVALIELASSGDRVVRTAADVWAKYPVGADGRVYIADNRLNGIRK